MGNILKMDKQDLIKRLIGLGWSNRKINRSTGIHRDTISVYRQRFEREKTAASSDQSDQSSGDPADA